MLFSTLQQIKFYQKSLLSKFINIFYWNIGILIFQLEYWNIGI